MDVTPILAIVNNGASQVKATKPDSGGFEQILTQAQAPPGPEPPPGIAIQQSGEEQKTVEPNAQSKKPDFLPNIAQIALAQNLTGLLIPQTSGAVVDPNQLSALSPTQTPLQLGDFKGVKVLSTQPILVSPDKAAIDRLLATDQLNGTAVQPIAVQPAVDSVSGDQILKKAGGKDFSNSSPDSKDLFATAKTPSSATQVDPKGEKKGPTKNELPMDSPVEETLKPTSAAIQTAPKSNDVQRENHSANQPLAGSAQMSTSKPAPQADPAVQPTQVATQQDSGLIAVASTAAKTDDVQPASDKKEVKTNEVQVTSNIQALNSMSDTRKAQAVQGAAATQPSKAQVSSVINQVADRIEYLAATKPSGGVTIHLDPKDLGNITLVVKQTSGSIDAQMYSDNAQVRQMLQQHQPMLGVALQNRGYTLNSISVGSQTAQAGGDNARQAFQQHQPQQNRPTLTSNAQPDSGSRNDRSRRVANATGVDLWI